MEREFAPAVDDKTLERWRDAIQRLLPDEPPAQPTDFFQPVDEGGREGAKLARSLMPALGSARATERFSWRGIDQRPFPFVRVKVDGEVRYANPLVADGEFGRSYVAGNSAAAGVAAPASDVLPMTGTLSIATTANPTRRVPVARGEWSAEDLVGRQLLVQLAPAMDIETALASRVRDIQAFVPVLALTGVDLDAKTRERLSIAGTAITTSGETIEVRESGSARVNGTHQGRPRPSAAGKVRALKIALEASGFPTINLRVGAFDARGRSLEGLESTAFRVSETGQPQVAIVRDRRTSPRVLFLLDQSSSIPKTFLGEVAERLARTLAEQIRASKWRWSSRS